MPLRINNSSGKARVSNAQGSRATLEESLPVAFDNLIAYYPFRDGSAVDVSGRDTRFGDSTDYSATVNGPVFKPSSGVNDVQSGANSGAFQFDGTDDTINGDIGNVSLPLSFSAFIKTSSGGDEDIVGLGDSGGDGNKLGLIRKSDGNLKLLFAFDDIPLGFEASLDDGRFHHIAGTFTQDNLQEAYVDGIKIGENQGSFEYTGNGVLSIGGELKGSQGQFFSGTLDDVRIYDTALTDRQVYQIYRNTRPATKLDSLAARYTFNDGSAQDQTAGVPVSGDSTDYSGTLNGTTEAEEEGINDG